MQLLEPDVAAPFATPLRTALLERERPVLEEMEVRCPLRLPGRR